MIAVTVGKTKKFSKADYNKYNGPGVGLSASLFEFMGYTTRPFVEDKGKKDFWADGPSGLSYRIEGERRTREAGKPINTYIQGGEFYFPYDTLHIVQRKQEQDKWDYHCQIMDCYNFDDGEQTVAIAVVDNRELNNLVIRPCTTRRNGELNTVDEEMGDLDINKVWWFAFNGVEWEKHNARYKGHRDMERKFREARLTWETDLF